MSHRTGHGLHDHVRHRVRRGRRAQRAYAWLTRFDDVETLEELQRDLEEAAADVAERIKRLLAAQATEAEPEPGSSPGADAEPAI